MLSPKRLIGILTWREGKRFEEPDYLRMLIREGQKLGAVVYLFSHQDVFALENKIRGFIPTAAGGWESRWFGWPDVVIDRYRKREPAYMKLRHSKLFHFANSPFGKKWRVTQLLADDPRVSRWIPETIVYSHGSIRKMLMRHPIVYVKPGNGTGGRSIVKVFAKGSGYRLFGRDKQLVQHTAYLPDKEAAEGWVNRWVREQRISNGNFLVQQGLDLELVPGRVADIRLLIQKNSEGKWSVTGSGVRVGGKDSSTSNLLGGGKAIPFQRVVARHFGKERALSIMHETHQMAHQVAMVLEEKFGRMMEFGLDIGVEVDGRSWLIEVNPKPGRKVFLEMGQMDLYRESIRRPIEYALHLTSESRSNQGEKADNPTTGEFFVSMATGGEPTLMTHSPTLVWAELPSGSGKSLQSASILMTA